MPKLAEVFRGEIVRISRREARIATAGVREAKIKLIKTVADLKRKIAKLQGENKWLVAAEKKRLVQKPQLTPETSKKARLTSKGIRRLRRKLGLSQANFAKLLGRRPKPYTCGRRKRVRSDFVGTPWRPWSQREK